MVKQLIQLNNTYYLNEDVNSDLLTLRDVTLNKQYTPKLPYIVNTDIQKPIFQNLSIKHIRDKFNPLILHMIEKYKLVLCGGYIYKLLIKKLQYEGIFDMDLFIVDHDVSQTHLNKKVDSILKYLVDIGTCKHIKLNRNVIEVHMLFGKYNIKEILKVQIILKIYASISQILHGFDLGSSCVAFDGKEIYFTSMGKFAYETGYNILDLSRKSKSYEYRVKKYLKRGFGVIMPNLKIFPYKGTWFGSLMDWYEYIMRVEHKNVHFDLPYFNIRDATVKGNKISVNPSKIKTPMSRTSDYEDFRFDIKSLDALSKHNIHKIMQKDVTSITFTITPDWQRNFIDKYERKHFDIKTYFKPLNVVQLNLLKEVMQPYTIEDPNKLLEEQLEKIKRDQKNKIMRVGFDFSIIEPTHVQYGQFEIADVDCETWYDKYYRPY